jgi:hypothetical protein
MNSSCKPDATEVASAAPSAPAAPEPAPPLPAAPEPAALVAAPDPATARDPALDPASAPLPAADPAEPAAPLLAAAVAPADDAAAVCVPNLPGAPLVPADDATVGAELPAAAVGGVLPWVFGPAAPTDDPSVALEPASPLLQAAATQVSSQRTHIEEQRRLSCFIIACRVAMVTAPDLPRRHVSLQAIERCATKQQHASESGCPSAA